MPFLPEEYHGLPVVMGLMAYCGPVEDADGVFAPFRELAETILERVSASTAMMAVTQIRVLGGAMARVPSDATAFAHRDKPIMVNVAVLVQSPDDLAQHESWVAGLLAEVTQGDAGAYVGFLADEGEDRIRAAYPEPTWDRLRQVKAQYDPDNVFRLNQNIAPA